MSKGRLSSFFYLRSKILQNKFCHPEWGKVKSISSSTGMIHGPNDSNVLWQFTPWKTFLNVISMKRIIGTGIPVVTLTGLVRKWTAQTHWLIWHILSILLPDSYLLHQFTTCFFHDPEAGDSSGWCTTKTLRSLVFPCASLQVIWLRLWNCLFLLYLDKQWS